MSTELFKQLKKAMGYKQPITCGQCVHFKEKPNPFLDRDWVWVCTFNNITDIPVDTDGTCKEVVRK